MPATLSSLEYYQRSSETNCKGPVQLLQDFRAAADQCVQKAYQINATGFVRVISGSQFAGKCYFFGGAIDTPTPYFADNRDCYRLVDKETSNYIERSLVADPGKQVGALLDHGLQQCKDHCDIIDDCNSFSFHSGEKVCQLYSKVVTSATLASSNLTMLQSWRTYYRACPSGYNHSHNGYWNNAFDELQSPYGRVIGSDHNTTIYRCAAQCDSTEGCIAFNLANGSNCWIYNSLGSQAEDADNIACIRKSMALGDLSGAAANTNAEINLAMVIPLSLAGLLLFCLCFCCILRQRSKASEQRAREKASKFPDFECQTTEGTFSFHSYLDRQDWTVFFTYLQDFKPVCTTEISTCHALLHEFRKRNAQLIGLSCDKLEQHEAWAKDILASERRVQSESLGFPLISDESREILEMLGMLDPVAVSEIDGLPLASRGLFLIGPGRRTRFSLFYPANTGRNFAEVLRILDSLYVTSSCGVGTPAGWHAGDPVVPNIRLDGTEAAQGNHKDQMQKQSWWDPQFLHNVQGKGEEKTSTSQGDNSSSPALKVYLGAELPDFECESTSATGTVSFYKQLDQPPTLGGSTVIMCWPPDLSPITTSELTVCHQMQPEFYKRGVKLMGLSSNTREEHLIWCKTVSAFMGDAKADLGISLISDESQEVAGWRTGPTQEQDALTRGLLVLDSEKKVRLAMLYPGTTGFNMFEVLRVVDSLLCTSDSSVATPASWQPGDAFIAQPEILASPHKLRMVAAPGGQPPKQPSREAPSGHPGEQPLTPGSPVLKAKATSCSQCGNVYMADAVYCRHCGQKREQVDITIDVLSPFQRNELCVEVEPPSPRKQKSQANLWPANFWPF